MCKVPNCKETHDRHHCKLCKSSDSDHCSSECPQGHIYYHATSRKYVESIERLNRLRASKEGNLGKGVYFTNWYAAYRIGKLRATQNKEECIVILKCLVFLGKIDKDFSTGKHGEWAGLKEFTEICLRDETRCQILEYDYCPIE